MDLTIIRCVGIEPYAVWLTDPESHPCKLKNLFSTVGAASTLVWRERITRNKKANIAVDDDMSRSMGLSDLSDSPEPRQ